MWDGKVNASELLMTRRKTIQSASKPGSVVGPGQVQAKPVYGLGGVRRGGSASPFQALVGNVGTCRLDAKGEIPKGSPLKEKSTDARHRGGAARSSVDVTEKSRSKGAASSSWANRSTRKGRSP